MAIGMATRKVTITVDERHLQAVQQMVAAGKAPNVSAFVQRAIVVALNDAAGWQAMLEAALVDTGGPPTKQEAAWADRALGTKSRRRHGAG